MGTPEKITHRLRVYFLLVIFIVTAIIAALPALPVRSQDATCGGTLATDKGHARQTLHIAQAGTYTLWMRMLAPNADADSVYAQLDTSCVVVSTDSRESGSTFVWVNYREGDATKKMTFDLKAGDHAMTLAGREAGAGVDKVMLVGNSCHPTGNGDNCLDATVTSSDITASSSAEGTGATAHSGMRWWVIALGTVAILGAALFLVRHYIICMRHHGLVPGTPIAPSPYADNAVVGVVPSSPGFLQKVLLFIRHHVLLVALCGAIMTTAGVASAVFAAEGRPIFEAEAATLIGGVKVVDNTSASGGKYIVFERNGAAGTVGGDPAKPTPAASNSGSSSSPGSTSSGTNGNNSGSSGTPSPSYPYPDRYSVGAPGVARYAQSDASLPVPAGYTEYFPSNANVSNAYNLYNCSGTLNIDRAYFHAFLYIGTGCHGTINITNSIIAPPPGTNQRAILVNADNSASLTINISDTTIRPEPVPLGGTNNALTDHVINDCETCTIHLNRLDVANSGGMCLCGRNTIVENSWLHDSYIAHLANPGDAHTGGVFPYGGSGPLEIRYNRLEPGVNAYTGAPVTDYWKAITAVLFTQGSGGSMLRNYKVHHNFISLGSFNMGLENGENLEIYDNVFGPNHFGQITTCSSGCTVSIAKWTNNFVGDITGKPTATAIAKPF